MLRPEVFDIFRTERPMNLKLGTQMEYEPTGAVISKSKVQVARSRDASDRCWLISRERNVLQAPKLVDSLHTSKIKDRGHQVDLC